MEFSAAASNRAAACAEHIIQAQWRDDGNSRGQLQRYPHQPCSRQGAPHDVNRGHVPGDSCCFPPPLPSVNDWVTLKTVDTVPWGSGSISIRRKSLRCLSNRFPHASCTAHSPSSVKRKRITSSKAWPTPPMRIPGCWQCLQLPACYRWNLIFLRASLPIPTSFVGNIADPSELRLVQVALQVSDLHSIAMTFFRPSGK